MSEMLANRSNISMVGQLASSVGDIEHNGVPKILPKSPDTSGNMTRPQDDLLSNLTLNNLNNEQGITTDVRLQDSSHESTNQTPPIQQLLSQPDSSANEHRESSEISGNCSNIHWNSSTNITAVID